MDLVGGGIASILHRDTIAALVGARTFERGEACFADGRVVEVAATRGELRGRVRPVERARADYGVRIWLRAEGVAYECSCPVGVRREFCKHAVAIALAHLAEERARVEREHGVLRDALATVPPPALIAKLLERAHADVEVATMLKQVCLEVLAQM